MFWDTTKYPAEYPEKIKKIYFKENIVNRKPFTRWIGNISKKFSHDIDWWMTIPLTRDPYQSNLYHYICILKTLKYLKKEKKNIIIKASSKTLLNIIKKWSEKNKIEIRIQHIKKDEKIKNFLILLKSITFNLILFFFIKKLTKKVLIKKVESRSVLIDTFATKESINSEHYYRGLDKFFKKNKINHVYFVPTFIIEINFFNIIKIIRALNKRNYLFKEHYIKVKDILFASFHFLRVKKYITKYEFYSDWDLSDIICEEINSLKNYSSKINGILNYRFAKNLSDQKVDISKTINWFENQIIDKGWNLGFRKYFSHTKTYGYQGGLNYPHFMNSFPAQYEEQAKVIPSEILVIGKAYKNLKKEFFPKIKISVAPALNYQNIFTINLKRKKMKVLAVLNGIKSIDLKLLEWISAVQKINKKINILVKPHPILPLNKINTDNNDLLKKLKISNESLPKLLEETAIVICTGPTSATIESLAYNCFLLVPVIDPFDEYTLKILNIPRGKYTFIYNKAELIEILKKKIDSGYNFSIKKLENFKLRNTLFEKISKNNLKVYY